jgi:hypothetical protein
MLQDDELLDNNSAIFEDQPMLMRWRKWSRFLLVANAVLAGTALFVVWTMLGYFKTFNWRGYWLLVFMTTVTFTLFYSIQQQERFLAWLKQTLNDQRTYDRVQWSQWVYLFYRSVVLNLILAGLTYLFWSLIL